MSASPPSPSRPRSSATCSLTTPYNMDTRFYSDAPGLAILAAANRAYGWTPEHAETVLLWMLARRCRSRRGRRPPSRAASRARSRSPRPCSRSAGTSPVKSNAARGSTAFRGPADGATCRSRPPGSIALRAASRRSTSGRRSPTRTASGCSSSGTARSSGSGAWTARRPGPGPTLTPDLAELATASSHGDPGYRLRRRREQHRARREGHSARRAAGGSYQIEPPLRLASSARGIFADGWIGSNTDDNRVSAGYSRFVDPHPAAGRCSSRSAGRHGAAIRTCPGHVIIQRRDAEARAGAERRSSTA